MLVICLNGSVNSGKATTGQALATLISGARFIDADDHGAPEGTSFAAMLKISMARLEREIAAARAPVLIIANPLRDEDFARLHAAASARAARLVVVTLAPALDSVVVDRGARRLTLDERARVAEMYREGYHQRAFTDLLITDAPSPAAAARDIVMRLSQMSVTPLFP